jgi:GntR family transcriptional regulator, transcriptional repressor for pyruvate dehydrogenase complex
VIERQTITAQVITYILQLIKKGEVKPGQRLPTEKQLTETLGVSRTCVREAIKSLESLRLIRVRPKIGAVVLEPSPTALISAEHLSASAYMQQTDALVEFRKILEVGLAALAAEKSNEADLAAIRAALADFEHAVNTDRIAHHADLAFHKAIADATKNPIAILVLRTISDALMERSRQNNERPGVLEEGLREHWKIYRAIKEHNPEKARNAMRLHMQSVERYTRIVRATDESEVDLALPQR